jgi:hypothetical protein
MTVYKCENCEKIFKQKSHFTDHLNKKFPCKSKNIIYEKNIIIENDLDIIVKLKLENEKLRIENEKLKDDTTNKNNEINIVNNGNIIINNNVNIIQIVNHGEEDYKKINMNEILQNLPKLEPFNCISSMIYYIHCNDGFPEYQNIYITDLSRGKMKMFKDNEWKSVETKPVVEILYNKIIEYYDDVSMENDKIYSNFTKEVKKTYPCSSLYKDKYRKNGINNSINILYDNREKIKAIKINKKINPIEKKI